MEWRDIPVDDLELSVRSRNCLRTAGYETLGQVHDLFQSPKSEVLGRLQYFGARSYREVYEVLHLAGQNDDRTRIADWVRTHTDTVRAILDGRAAVVRLWRDTDV